MMMNYRIGQGSGMLLLDKQLIRQEMMQAEKPGTRKLSFRHSRLELLGDQLEHGQREEFEKTLQECASIFAAVDSLHYTPAMEVYYAIGLVFLTYMNRWNLVDTAAAQVGLHKLMQPGEHSSWQEAFGYLLQVGGLLFSLQSQEEERRAKAVVTIIQKHILEHLHDPDEISLVRLAELVYFNPSYLSRLFKQVTEINLSEYITGARMGKAKQLLSNPEIKIQEVAELVGYGTATNFTRFFRKSMNMTPQEYRSLVLSR
ncbi:HTH-type transcriptional regulator YesS [compost metagenome]